MPLVSSLTLYLSFLSIRINGISRCKAWALPRDDRARLKIPHAFQEFLHEFGSITSYYVAQDTAVVTIIAVVITARHEQHEGERRDNLLVNLLSA